MGVPLHWRGQPINANTNTNTIPNTNTNINSNTNTNTNTNTHTNTNTNTNSLYTWVMADVIAHHTSVSKIAFSQNKSEWSLLLKACSILMVEFIFSSSSRKA